MTVRLDERQIQKGAAFYIPQSLTLQACEYCMCHISPFGLNFKYTCTDPAHFSHLIPMNVTNVLTRLLRFEMCFFFHSTGI